MTTDNFDKNLKDYEKRNTPKKKKSVDLRCPVCKSYDNKHVVLEIMEGTPTVGGKISMHHKRVISEEDCEVIAPQKVKIKYALSTAYSPELMRPDVAKATLYVYASVIDKDVIKFGIETKEINIICDYIEYEIISYDGKHLGNCKTQDNVRRITRAYLEKKYDELKKNNA